MRSNDRAAAGKGKPDSGGWNLRPRWNQMGTRLLIDHFQLRADLRVNVERFHQVAAFQRQCKQQQKKMLAPKPFDGSDPVLSALQARGRMC